MRHKKTGDLRLFPLPHASMFWKFIKNWEAYLLAPGLHCRGRGGWAAWSPPENTRKMPQSMEMCFRGMWSVHRMSCILLAVCLRNLFIYSVSIFFLRHCCCQPLPSLGIRSHGPDTWPMSLIVHPGEQWPLFPCRTTGSMPPSKYSTLSEVKPLRTVKDALQSLPRVSVLFCS